MQSHLGGGSRQEPPKRKIFTGNEVDERAGGGIYARNVHGAVVNAEHIREHDRGAYGEHGVLEGAPEDPRQKMHSEAGLPYEARDWYGSATHYTESELPINDFMGMGFHGSTEIFSAAEMEQRDRVSGTSYQPLQPGAYQLADGNILLVGKQKNQRAVVTPEQFMALREQAVRIAQQPQRPGLMNRILGITQQRG